MSTVGSHAQPSLEEALALADMAGMALAAQNLEDFAGQALPGILASTGLPAACLYAPDSRPPAPRFFQHGLPPDAAQRAEALLAEHFEPFSSQAGSEALSAPIALLSGAPAELVLHPLRVDGSLVGLIGLAGGGLASPAFLDRLSNLLAGAVNRMLERARAERQLLHLNTYLTVSSMLSQSLSLHELLEIALYSCMEAVSAEAASVLLLDDEKRNFNFYQAEGPAKPVLMSATFPADKGLAGSVLQTQQAEVINDVRQDPRFYQVVDTQTGFQTRNMIAVPLVAGEEKIGVLEMLNKSGGGPFTERERLLLVSIAEEVAFAIRNAMVFEYVVNTYCKQRQGLMTCRGCQRPLGSWTPCVKYREVGVWSEG